MNVFEYKVIKHSWGIRIVFELDEQKGTFQDNSIKINDSFYVTITKIQPLTDRQKWYIIKAFELVSQNIKIEKNDVLNIIINKLIYSYTDFQEEGLFCGIVQWAASYYQFQAPKFEVDFNTKINKYIFSNIPLYK